MLQMQSILQQEVENSGGLWGAGGGGEPNQKGY
jgi:hypothetical protein